MHETTLTAASLWAAKTAGAIVGSAISIAYVLPKGRRDAAVRFCTGVAGGMVFGTTVGVKLADELAITEHLSQNETVLMGSAVASLAIWWVMGPLLRALKSSETKSARTDAKHDGDD